jgi:uncharacterized protein (TIGR01370 family)
MKKKVIFISFVISLLVFTVVCSLLLYLFFKTKKTTVSDDVSQKKNVLEEAQSWAYDINFESDQDIEKLALSNFDVLVIDRSDVPDIQKLKTQKDKIVLCYLSIGQAESSRTDMYWKNEWKIGSPSWITHEDPFWKGNFDIKFWTQEWQNILYGGSGSYVDSLINSDCDGIYLDTAGLDYWKSLGKSDAEEEMISLIENIADYARTEKNDLLIVPQNLGLLDSDYSERLQGKIDAVGQEEVFYGYENNDGEVTPEEVSQKIQKKLDLYKDRTACFCY